jgi:hypothetical protein
MFDVMGAQITEVLSQDRSPHLLLREFYGAIGLRLSWQHLERRLQAELETRRTLGSAGSARPSGKMG